MGELRYRPFEEFHVGDTYSEKRVITEKDVEIFADITGDHNAIHLDEEYAKTTFFGHRLVHGMLIIGVLSAVCSPFFGNGSIYMGHTQKFLAPIYLNDEITCALEITKTVPEKQLLTFRAWVTKADGTVAVDGEITVKIIKHK